MIEIIYEFYGVNKVYSVIDMRTLKTFSRYNTLEKARIRKEKEIRKLYKGSGVLGNEITL